MSRSCVLQDGELFGAGSGLLEFGGLLMDVQEGIVDKVLRLSDRYVLYRHPVGNRRHFLFEIHGGKIYRLNEVGYIIL